MRQVLVVGGGGHALVLVDALLLSGDSVLGVLDAEPSSKGRRLCGVPIIGDDSQLERFDRRTVTLINGIGGVGSPSALGLRQRLQVRLEALGWSFGSVRHPAATVSQHAQLEEGTQVLAGAVIQAAARVDRGVIVNTGAIVEHDVTIGAWAHIAPGAVLCGAVSVGDGSHVGAASVVRQGIRLGAGTVVGAGAVVVQDFGGNGILTGVPAQERSSRR